ncbi:ABC transporter permease [Paraburkholderia sp. C35]|uniref:ABC transporter permease n=1 Tax=Paraburkholderia sp. C35 TaxID=2126993 RepID=UPI000D68ABC3|nr:ABC transporter permease [Paraburkholderia sp. C35]
MFRALRSPRLICSIGTLGCTLALWYALTALTGAISPAKLPSPVETWQALVQVATDGYADGRLDQHIVQSVKLVLYGFVVAALTGVPLGLWMGGSRRAQAFFNPVFVLLRPIPPLAWIPLAIVWLGLGDAAKVMVIWFAAFVPCVINSFAGVRNLDVPMLEAADMLGLRGARRVFEVTVPGALPMIFTGLRLSLQASWTTLVAGELIGAVTGLGHLLTQGSLDINPAMIVVAMLTVALCGWLMTSLLGVIERKLMPWRSNR